MNAVPWIPGSYYTVPMNPDLMEDLHIFGTIGVFILWAWDYSLYLYIDDIRHIMGMGPGILLYRRYPNPIILLIHCAWHDQPWAYQAGTSLTMIVAIKSTSSSIYISIYIYTSMVFWLPYSRRIFAASASKEWWQPKSGRWFQHVSTPKPSGSEWPSYHPGRN